jgi:multiple antibiotic resistance protein
MDQYFGYAVAILFATLGPLKTIPVFYALTHGAQPRYRAKLAFRAVTIATALVACVAFGAAGTLQKWHFSIDAITIVGGVILFVAAIHMLSSSAFDEAPGPASDSAEPPRLTWVGKPTLSPLVMPVIITPTAFVAIPFFVAHGGDNEEFRAGVFLLLGAMLLLDFIGMLLATRIMRTIRPAQIQLASWVFALIQAGLAVQAVLDSLDRIRMQP